MARLSAADPALDLRVDEAARTEICRRVLGDQGAKAKTVSPRRSWITHHSPAIAVPTVALIAAAALAGSGVIGLGRPVETGPPSASLTEPGSGGAFAGSMRLLPVSALDPAGRQPWGKEACAEQPNDSCIQPGLAVPRRP
jgi:hypothetical protein